MTMLSMERLVIDTLVLSIVKLHAKFEDSN